MALCGLRQHLVHSLSGNWSLRRECSGYHYCDCNSPREQRWLTLISTWGAGVHGRLTRCLLIMIPLWSSSRWLQKNRWQCAGTSLFPLLLQHTIIFNVFVFLCRFLGYFSQLSSPCLSVSKLIQPWYIANTYTCLSSGQPVNHSQGPSLKTSVIGSRHSDDNKKAMWVSVCVREREAETDIKTESVCRSAHLKICQERKRAERESVCSFLDFCFVCLSVCERHTGWP